MRRLWPLVVPRRRVALVLIRMVNGRPFIIRTIWSSVIALLGRPFRPARLFRDAASPRIPVPLGLIVERPLLLTRTSYRTLLRLVPRHRFLRPILVGITKVLKILDRKSRVTLLLSRQVPRRPLRLRGLKLTRGHTLPRTVVRTRQVMSSRGPTVRGRVNWQFSVLIRRDAILSPLLLRLLFRLLLWRMFIQTVRRREVRQMMVTHRLVPTTM